MQLVDAGLSLVLVLAGVGLALARHRAGDVALLYFTGYGLGRFLLELARGDSARPAFLGVSEAQWTALALAGLAAIVRPGVATALASCLLLVGASVLMWARRHRLWLTSPWHIDELSRVLGELAPGEAAVTRLGLRVSMRELPERARDYIVSLPGRALSERAVRALVWQLGLGEHAAVEVRAGRTAGLVHVVTRPASSYRALTGDARKSSSFMAANPMTEKA